MKKFVSGLIFFILLSGVGCKSTEKPGDVGERETTSAPGEETYGQSYLGIIFIEHPRGVRVVNVLPNSPAQKSGIRGGDVILSLDGDRLSGQFALRAIIRKLKPGSEVKIELLRDGDILKTVTATVETLPPGMETGSE